MPTALGSAQRAHCTVERLSFSLDADVCELVWRHEGALKAFSPKLDALIVAGADAAVAMSARVD